MNIIVPKETYPLERRVVVAPSSTEVLVRAGHKVYVQAGAAGGIDIADERYSDAGATVIADSVDLYAQAQDGLVIKIKAPSPEEFSFIKKAILFCMLHTRQNPVRVYYLGLQNLVGVAMEEIRDAKDRRLIDQTDITGEVGVYYALRHSPKIPQDMKAVILGYGSVATGAITACAKLGMEYKILRRREFKHIPLWLKDADLLINAIAWPEKQREKREYLVTREDIRNAKSSMIVLDLSVDFPNPIETVRPTNYQNPFYMEEGRVHISIYGYPGLVPVTSSRIYSGQVLPIALAIANNGGLNGINRTGDLGASIHKAIVDPSKYDWGQYKPQAPQASRIE